MAISRSQINNIKDFDLRTILLGMYDQHVTLGSALGINILEPTNSPQQPATAPPPQCIFTAAGKNGAVTVQITNPSQSINKTIYHELSYSTVKSFVGGSTVTLPVSTSTHQTFQVPGVTAYWRLRSSYDQNNWNSYQLQAATVKAGLVSSAASESATVLNQTNYASVDSADAGGGTANVRIFGKAGPNTQFPAVKGAAETILPSATVINVPLSSQQVVGFDGTNFKVRGTLPEVLVDGDTPIGSVSVVGGGTPTPPVIAPIISGGAILGYNVSNGGSGATAPYTLTLGSVGGGFGATFGPQTIVGGVLLAVAPGNPGASYSGGTTVIVSGGGTFSGSTGGGQNIGGNGGRLITNDGTTG
jgi:hypothetical protein